MDHCKVIGELGSRPRGRTKRIRRIISSFFGTPNEANWPDHKALPLCTPGLQWDNVPGIPFREKGGKWRH
jgi:hypothetical protein